MTAINLSISQLSTEFEMTRETIRKRLAAIGVKEAGRRKNYPVFRLKDAIKACLTGADADPNTLDPFRRRAHWAAETAELRLGVERGDLVQVADCREVYAAAMRPVAMALDTLPDILERDAGLTPQQTGRAERAIDDLRDQLVGVLDKELNRVRDSR